MDSIPTQAGHVIAKCGGRTSLARLLGHKNPTTVQRWDESGAIPEKHWRDILRAAQSAGIALQPEDFVAHLKAA